MTKQTINLGTAPTGVGGDTPRSAFTKTQSNFDELYIALGASGSPGTLPTALPVAQGGTGGATQAAARTGLGLGSAAIVDVVGLMTNSAIIEKGSNASGSWTKYSDGTMICTLTYALVINITTVYGAIFYGAVPSLAFSQTFIATPSLSYQVKVPGGGGWLGRDDLVSTGATGGSIVISPVSRPAQSVVMDYIAVGRWKA
ncbi:MULTISPECIES: phage tail protein [Pseudomonas]|uniref:phage tail protein n=1 Tax=Pseudomonas TaxID=286 RepID=UPI001070D5AF|nr:MULTISPECIES: phage tail protein [Pseudomonas]QBR32818.1 phage tail protein [Pseudomonas sp. S150]UZT90999.1 phage tail protein [Pseudomonas koreensis]